MDEFGQMCADTRTDRDQLCADYADQFVEVQQPPVTPAPLTTASPSSGWPSNPSTPHRGVRVAGRWLTE